MKRFWAASAVEPAEGGFVVRLDSRALMTPAKAPLRLPTRALADAIAAEWDAQGETVDPRALPFTRLANTALDRVAPRRAEVAAEIAAYGGTDLLCYRARHPEELAAREAEAWDPLLAWAHRTLGARLAVAEGVMHLAQPREALAPLEAAVAAEDAWALTALHELVTLSGSLVLGLAVRHRRLDPSEAWRISRIDEAWQTEQWGEDAEAAAAARRRQADFARAAELLELLG